MDLRSFIRRKVSVLNANSAWKRQEQKFLDASVHVLRSNFPNPDRAGCPDPRVLRNIGRRRLPLKDAARWTEHLGGCSDCFRDFEKSRESTRRLKRIRLVYAAAVMLALFIFAFIWFGSPTLLSKAQQEAVLDLRQVSTNRGVEGGVRREMPTLPAASGKVLIYVPLGAEGFYRLELLNAFGKIVAVATGETTIKNSSTVLPVRLDLSGQRPGIYSLRLLRDRGPVQVYKVRIR